MMRPKLVVADHVRTAAGVPGDALLLHGGRIAAVGAAADLRRPGIVEERFPGAVIVPGLRDAHLHPVSYAALLGGLNLADAPDLATVLARVGAAAGRGDATILGRRLDEERLRERRLPTRDDLDRVVSDRPVLLERICGHVAVANTPALTLAGIGATTPDPPGGHIDRDLSGVPTGILRETAVDLVATRLRVTEPVSPDTFCAALRGLAGLGLTSIGAIVGCAQDPERDLALLEAAAPRLPLRLGVLVVVPTPAALRDAAERLSRLGPMVRWLGVKCFADGSFGGRTAALGAAYADAPHERGTLRLAEADLGLARVALELGGMVAVHAIGDLACRRALDGFAGLVAAGAPPEDLRLEHASLLTEEDVLRIARLGIVASVQPAFLGSERDWLPRRLGPDRLRRAYPFRSLLAAGALLAGGSDCPVEPPHPLRGMALARDRNGITPEEALSADQALHLFTAGAARALREPPPLAPGSPADYVLLDGDPVAATPEELASLQVLETCVAGRPVVREEAAPAWEE